MEIIRLDLLHWVLFPPAISLTNGPFLGSGLAALFYSLVKFVEYDTERAERLKLSRGDNSVEMNVEGDSHVSREKNGTGSYVQGDAGKTRDHEDIGGIDMV